MIIHGLCCMSLQASRAKLLRCVLHAISSANNWHWGRMRVGSSGREVAFFSFLAADCFGCVFGCNFWKSRSLASPLWWVPYRCLLCKVLGPLYVAGLQISFLMSETHDKYFFAGAISGKQEHSGRGEDAVPGLPLLGIGAAPGPRNEHLCPGASDCKHDRG